MRVRSAWATGWVFWSLLILPQLSAPHAKSEPCSAAVGHWAKVARTEPGACSDSRGTAIGLTRESPRGKLALSENRLLRLRGGEEPSKEKTVPIYEQLREAESLHRRGILSDEDFSKERGRLAVELAMGTLQDVDDYESDTSDEDGDPEEYLNYTLGRLANNAIAKRQAWGSRETVDAFARGMRWDKSIGYSKEEEAILARARMRFEAERERGMDNAEVETLLDPRRVWAEAAQSLFDDMASASSQEPLSNISFFARKDLAVGETITVALLNFTGPPQPVPFKVESSPVGKVSHGVWMNGCKSLNLTVASSIFQDEPITVFLPGSCNITVDTQRVSINREHFLTRLFMSPRLLPALPPRLLTNASEQSPPPSIPRGKVMRVVGLQGAPHFNGFHASVLGIAGSRYQVQLIETGKKLLVSPRNLEEIAEASPSQRAIDEAARDAWELVDSMHRAPTRLRNASGADNKGGQRQRHLDADEIRELAALNISVGDAVSSPFNPITHCDGGFGRHVFTLDGREYQEDGRGLLDRTRSSKEIILDLHLQHAVMDGNAERVAELIQAGASTDTTRLPGTPHGDYQRTPLQIAAWECNPTVVEVLLHARANVNARDVNNATALHHAAVKGDHDIVHMLLDAGADPCIKNTFNRTAIHRAVFYGHAAVAQTLLSAAGSAYDRAEIADISNLGAIPLSRLQEFHEYD